MDEKDKQNGRSLLKINRNQKGRNGEAIWKIAERKVDCLICHEGAERAEQIIRLMLERIQAVRANLAVKYGG